MTKLISNIKNIVRNKFFFDAILLLLLILIENCYRIGNNFYSLHYLKVQRSFYVTIFFLNQSISGKNSKLTTTVC